MASHKSSIPLHKPVTRSHSLSEVLVPHIAFKQKLKYLNTLNEMPVPGVGERRCMVLTQDSQGPEEFR